MSRYYLNLIPTVKEHNAVICRIETAFSIDTTQGTFSYEKGKIYFRKDVKDILRRYNSMDKIIYTQPMHLHLTVDDINKGDWWYNEESDSIYKGESDEGLSNKSIDTVVICTTDTDLRNDVVVADKVIEQNVPNFHHMFIATYITKYNNGHELTSNISPQTTLDEQQELQYVVDEDNIMTVMVHFEMPVKNNYTRAELDSHLLAVMNLGMGLRQNQLSGMDSRSGIEVLNEYKSLYVN